MRSRRLRRIAIGLVVALALFTIFGCWIAPRIIRSQLESQLSAVLLRPTQVRAVHLDPFDLRLEIEQLQVADHDAPRLLAFERLVVDVAARQLFLGRLAFEEITLARPFIRLTLEPQGRLNISDVLDALAADAASKPPPPPDPDGAPPTLRIARLEIREGTLDFLDRSRPAHFATALTPLEIVVTDFSTERDRDNPYAFEARFDQDTRLTWTGEFSVRPLRSSGQLALEGLHLESFAPYLRDVTQLVIERGRLSIAGNYSVDASGPALAAEVSGGMVTLATLAITAPGGTAPVIALERAEVRDIAIDLASQAVRTGSVTLQRPALRVVRDQEGAIDLAAWAAPPARTSTPAAAAPAPATPQTSPPKPWTVTLGGIAIRDGQVGYTDHGTARPLVLAIDALTFDTAPLAVVPLASALDLKLGLRINGQGRIDVEGRVPLGAGPLDLKLAVDELELALAQPYIDPVARVELTSGTLSTHGQLQLRDGRTHYRGDLTLRGLAVRESEADREVCRLDELSLAGLDVALPPVVVGIDTLRVAGLRTQMVVNRDGKSNYDALAIPPAPGAAAPPSSAPGPGPVATIGALVLDGIRADYLDRSVSPPFAIKLTTLSGRIWPVRWPADRAARLDLAGRVDAAPLTVKGTVRPNGKRATLELGISLQGLDLLPASTYSAKYAGYPVAKGKLSLDLSYALAERKLEGKNLIVVDQLTLGDKVESPEATWLPVKLGLAILTDKSGRMELDLPVGGDLDDPEFGLGKIILRALTNVLEKVATSPFALLGAVVGGGDEAPADRVPFAAGSSVLDPTQAPLLDRIAKALLERPALRLSVGGTYDSATDGEALARARLMARIRDEQKRAGIKAPAVDDATWAARIRALYTARMGTKTGTRAPDFGELEAAVLGGEMPSATELAALADARAQAAQAQLVETLGAQRVFVATPESLISADRAVVLKVE